MEKLNDLVLLADRLHGEPWTYGRVSPHSRGYITGRNGRTIVQTEDGGVPALACRFIESCDPETILEIAAAFRELQGIIHVNEKDIGDLIAQREKEKQRAEAAEKESARLADWVKCVEAERDKNIAWHSSQLKRAEAAEAKLAELEKQEPTGWRALENDNRDLREPLYLDGFSEPTGWSSDYTPVYSRPAPAVSLAELVPEEVSMAQAEVFAVGEELSIAESFMIGANRMRAAIVRKIEGAKPFTQPAPAVSLADSHGPDLQQLQDNIEKTMFEKMSALNGNVPHTDHMPEWMQKSAADFHAKIMANAIDRGTIREIFLRNGFTIKDGQSDLKDYVYLAAYDLLSAAGCGVAK